MNATVLTQKAIEVATDLAASGDSNLNRIYGWSLACKAADVRDQNAAWPIYSAALETELARLGHRRAISNNLGGI